MSKGAMRFKSMTVGKQPNELARLRVLGGPDSGVVFVISSSKVTIGRAEDNDVMLSDLKASRKHAEIAIEGGVATMRDLGSSHGFLINGKTEKIVQLKNGDKIGMGGTVMEFLGGVNSGATQMIVRPPVQVAKQVGTGTSNSGLTQFIHRPAPAAGGASILNFPGSGGAAVAGKPAKEPSFVEKNKKLIGLLLVLFAMAGGSQEIDKRRAKPLKYVDPLAAAKQEEAPVLAKADTDDPAYKDAERHYREGMRELRADNFLRAMNDFDTALQIYPQHPLARVYKEVTKKRMEKVARERLDAAKFEDAANHIRNALNQCDAVKRMYANDQSNKLYKEADAKAQDLEKKLKEMEKQ